ncbi:MAG: hypothetical protein ACLP8S_34240 [Solirubrobacteraceae bacterium]
MSSDLVPRAALAIAPDAASLKRVALTVGRTAMAAISPTVIALASLT